MRRKFQPGCPCCGGSPICYNGCSPVPIPRTSLTATWNGPWDSGSGTLIYQKAFEFPHNDFWSFESPGPTSLGEHGTHIDFQCLNGVTFALIAAVIGTYLDPLHPELGMQWRPYDVCHSLLSSDYRYTEACLDRSPNLIETSNQAVPYQIAYDVVDTDDDTLATSYFSDLTIDGPDPEDVAPHECCSFCPIPKKDLTLTYTINSLCGSGSGTFSTPLVYNESLDRWEAATFSYQCVNRGLANYDFTFTFSCATGLVLRTQASGGTDISCAFYNYRAICDPFHLQYQPGPVFTGPPCPISYLVFTTVFIDE